MSRGGWWWVFDGKSLFWFRSSVTDRTGSSRGLGTEDPKVRGPWRPVSLRLVGKEVHDLRRRGWW